MILAPSDDAIARAVAILEAGGLVAFPTETVYGLGADARDADAVARIFAAKGRPSSNPIIAHVLDAEAARRWVLGWDERCDRLAAAFWPGPLTLVMPRGPEIPPIVSAGHPTLAIRAPAHPVAAKLLEAFGGPIAAPSANRSTSVSPTTAAHVARALGGDVALILDGGACEVGLESTVYDVAASRVLRPGRVTAREISAVLAVRVEVGAVGPANSPGLMRRHYAPAKPVRLFEAGGAVPEGVVVLRRGAGLPADPEGYGRALYAALHAADAEDAGEIWIERPPEGEAWAAIHDRLRRAAEKP